MKRKELGALCIQCRDIKTGNIGTFLASMDRPQYAQTGSFVAISPVMPGLVELYDWLAKNNWKRIKGTQPSNSVADYWREAIE